MQDIFNNGFIKIHRQLTKWEWYTDLPTKVLFLHLLLKANHKEEKWRGQTIKKGELISSYAHLAKECGLSVKQVRNALEKLKRTGEVAHQTTSSFSIISIKNWGKFQDRGTQQGKQRANEGQTRGTQGATNKNEKKEKNDKNILSLHLSQKITEDEREYLKKYALENGAKYPNPYVRKLIANGDYIDILKKYHSSIERQEQKKESRRQEIEELEKTSHIPLEEMDSEVIQKWREKAKKRL